MSSEAEFQADVVDRAHCLGLLVFHSTNPTRDIGPGFPDLVIAGPGGTVFAELKSEGGTLDPEQVTWKWKLLAGGARWFLWYPHDMPSVMQVLLDILRPREPDNVIRGIQFGSGNVQINDF